MASEEHKRLATIIKDSHDCLRQNAKLHGADRAWDEHLKNKDRLLEYADAMQQLANIWEENDTKLNMLTRSRVKWAIDYCNAYFLTNKIYLEKRQRELNILNFLPQPDAAICNYLTALPTPIKVLDVGSCFNPFGTEKQFAVTAIDLCPANADVLKGDFLQIKVIDTQEADMEISTENGEIRSLPSGYFQCVIFSLLLEYIPTSELRLECCRKSYRLLCAEGILIIITPDSQHVGKNAMLMKNWRYTLATLGFVRVRFEKLPHITCMAFRKASNPCAAQQWAQQHIESYMTVSLDIPQDSKS